MQFGEKFTEKITDNIEASQVFLFLSTKNACESTWTSKEIACADEFGKRIIPVRIDRTPYNKKVMFRIADLSYIDYGKNPKKGRQEIVDTIKASLNEIKVAEEQRLADEKRRQEEIALQRQKQEEERKRQEQIAKIENEIAALESKRTDCKKAVLLKEQELKLAQVDLDACEAKIQKLQKKLQELRNPQVKEQNKKEEQKKTADEQSFTVGNVSFKMIRVEGGNMGIFYIGETQVTQALWQAVMGNNPSQFEGLDHPVECVSWYDICGKDGKGTDPNCFLYKLNRKTGKNFRLPTEAEWEYAAKGGNESNNYTYAGSDNIDKVAWCYENNKNSTHPVKQLSPNELGIYDMSGNVWEWCSDARYEYKSGEEVNLVHEGESDSLRVLRGGSWYSFARNCRVSCRYGESPVKRNRYIGLRLVLPQ